MPMPPARYSTAATATSVANSFLRLLRLCLKAQLTVACQAYRPPPGGTAGSGRRELASPSAFAAESVSPRRVLSAGVELVRLLLALVACVGVDGAGLVVALAGDLGLALGHDPLPLRGSAFALCLRGPFLGFGRGPLGARALLVGR